MLDVALEGALVWTLPCSASLAEVLLFMMLFDDQTALSFESKYGPIKWQMHADYCWTMLLDERNPDYVYRIILTRCNGGLCMQRFKYV